MSGGYGLLFGCSLSLLLSLISGSKGSVASSFSSLLVLDSDLGIMSGFLSSFMGSSSGSSGLFRSAFLATGSGLSGLGAGKKVSSLTLSFSSPCLVLGSGCFGFNLFGLPGLCLELCGGHSGISFDNRLLGCVTLGLLFSDTALLVFDVSLLV